MQLDASLLDRLTSNSGDLLEDEELIQVLANTKSKAAEVNAKLIAADETKKNIAEKREQFRPAATRGSVLYFSIVEISLVNVMYQTSLQQFLELFMRSMDDVTLFLRGGAALDINSVKRKPFSWMSNDVWLNIVQLSQSNHFYSNLIADMTANESLWKRWYEDNEPEQMAIPNYEQRLLDQADIGPFLRLLLVRCLRVDRSILACKRFIRATKANGHCLCRIDN